MSTNSPTTVAARDLTELFASTIDALLQKWMADGIAGDKLGMTIASAQLAQVSHIMSGYFRKVAEDFCEGPTDLKASNRAIEQINDSVTKRMGAIRSRMKASIADVTSGPGTELATVPKPNGALN